MLYQSTVIGTREGADDLIREIIENFDDPETCTIGFDIETEMAEGRIGFSGEWVTAQFSARNLRTGWSKVAVVEAWKTGPDFMRPLIDAGIPLVAHNAGFEALVLRRYGLDVRRWHDTMLAQGVLALGTQRWYQSLALLARLRMGWAMGGKGTIQVSFRPNEELSPEQVAYAELDAVAAMFLHEILRDDLRENGLEAAYLLEVGALPGLVEMTWKGLPFNAKRWRSEVLTKADATISAAEMQLADLTGGGGQMGLFGGVTLPWKPDSAVDLRNVLNEYEDPDRIAAILPDRDKPVFRADDKADGVVIQRLANAGSPLAAALLDWRHWAKLRSTYGEKLLSLLGEDGAFHSNYKQAVVATGRWASDSPNGQNLAPEMKAFFEAPADRVFIMLDYSNMEMRVGASLAGDEVLIDAFRQDRDIHSNTAALMFGYDQDEFNAKLAAKDPKAVMDRKKAKPVNFGNFYGLGPQSLFESFQAQGIDITLEECRDLIDFWYDSYPGVKSWVTARDEFVTGFAKSASTKVDWVATLDLDAKARETFSTMAKLRNRLGRRAYPAEVAEESGMLSEEDVLWVQSFGEPVLLGFDGKPIEFVSRTISGRSRRFQVSLEAWYTAVLHELFTSKRSKPQALMEAWERAGHKPLSIRMRPKRDAGGNVVSWSVSRKAVELGFQNKALKRRFVTWVFEQLSNGGHMERVDQIRSIAAESAIRRLTNAYRNAPVQGGASEPMQSAIGMLWVALREQYPDAYLVQTVHDSLVINAPISEAAAVAELASKCMEDGFYRHFDQVPIKVDVEVGKTLQPAEKSPTTVSLDEFRQDPTPLM